MSRWYESAQHTLPSLAAQVDEAYTRTRAAKPEVIVPRAGDWTGEERRHGIDPNYHGTERRRGIA